MGQTTKLMLSVIHAGPGAMLGTKASHISDRSIWPTMHGNWGPQ